MQLGIYDKNGKEICENDIIAEGTVGSFLWDEQAIIVSRPTARVVVYDKVIRDYPVSTINGKRVSYNAIMLSKGKCKITDKAEGIVKEKIADEIGYGEYYLNTYDGVFQSWDEVEVIGHYEDA